MKIHVDPYVNRKTGVLINKGNFTSQEELEKMEAEFTGFRMRQLTKEPVKGEFDFEHLCKIHERIFGDVYEWAGCPRIIHIEKEEPALGGLSTQYSEPENIKRDADKVLGEMNAIKWDKLSLDEKASAFSKSMAELWKVHPFREGNTRTTVTFCCDFAESKGFGIDRELFKNNSEYVRRAMVAYTAKFEDLGDVSQPEHLHRIVKDGIQRWEKANQKQEERFGMSEWRNVVDRTSGGISTTGFNRQRENTIETIESEKE